LKKKSTEQPNRASEIPEKISDINLNSRNPPTESSIFLKTLRFSKVA